MSDVQTPSYAAGLFQKAHGRIVMLQRIDAQIAALLAQRRRIHEELGEARSEINGEFERLMHESDEVPSTVLGEIAGTRPRNGDGSGSPFGVQEHISGRGEMVGPQA